MYIHVVKKGDTIWKIANQYGVSTQRIISDNGLRNPRGLVVGQALLILIPKTTYTVRPRDTLQTIARQFGVTVMQLLQNNPTLIDAPYLSPGQVIVVDFQQEKRRQITLNAYAYPHINRSVLKRALPCLTYLTIFGYGFTVDGELIGIDDQPLIDLAYEYQTGPVMLLSTITEDGNFSGARAKRLFEDPALQDTVIANLLETMERKGYIGLDLDFEYIQPEDGPAYAAFLQKVTARMHEQGYFVNAALAPKTSAAQAGLLYEAHDYGVIGATVDTVLLMTYEWGYTYGPPMAVAPLNRVRQVVEYAVSEIPPEKIFLGIPNYGYDWILPFERGVTRATSIGNEYAVEIAARRGAEIQFDQTAQSPYFEYYSDGRKHVVWFEDVRSIQAKFDLLDEYGLRGAAYWNAMRPFSQNWAFVSAAYNIRKVL